MHRELAEAIRFRTSTSHIAHIGTHPSPDGSIEVRRRVEAQFVDKPNTATDALPAAPAH